MLEWGNDLQWLFNETQSGDVLLENQTWKTKNKRNVDLVKDLVNLLVSLIKIDCFQMSEPS